LEEFASQESGDRRQDTEDRTQKTEDRTQGAGRVRSGEEATGKEAKRIGISIGHW
jgi:hypothetical protein